MIHVLPSWQRNGFAICGPHPNIACRVRHKISSIGVFAESWFAVLLDHTPLHVLDGGTVYVVDHSSDNASCGYIRRGGKPNFNPFAVNLAFFGMTADEFGRPGNRVDQCNIFSVRDIDRRRKYSTCSYVSCELCGRLLDRECRTLAGDRSSYF